MESKKVFGVERSKLALMQEQGRKVNIKRVRRVMRLLGISSVIRRKRPNYVKSTPHHTAENIINRDFEASKPNEKGFTDVTYLTDGKGVKAYLSAIIDRYDLSVVAWKIGHVNDNQLVEDTVRMAFDANPSVTPVR